MTRNRQVVPKSIVALFLQMRGTLPIQFTFDLLTDIEGLKQLKYIHWLYSPTQHLQVL